MDLFIKADLTLPLGKKLRWLLSGGRRETGAAHEWRLLHDFNACRVAVPDPLGIAERRVAGNLNGTEAAGLGKDIGAGLVIPCHYHMFTFNTEEPDEFISACEEKGQNFQVMREGERHDFRK